MFSISSTWNFYRLDLENRGTESFSTPVNRNFQRKTVLVSERSAAALDPSNSRRPAVGFRKDSIGHRDFR